MGARMGPTLSAAALFAAFQLAAVAAALGIQAAVALPLSGSLFLGFSLVANTLGADQAGKIFGRLSSRPPGAGLLVAIAALLGLIWVLAWIAVWVLKSGDPGAALGLLVQGQTSLVVYGAIYALLTPIIGYYFQRAAQGASAVAAAEDLPDSGRAD